MQKTIVTISSFLISVLSFSQIKIYESPNGTILSEEKYKSAKISSLENMKEVLGSDYELYEELEVSKETNDSIFYKFKWEFLNEEWLAEKRIEEGLIGKNLEYESLNFLIPDEKNEIDKNKPTFVNFWFTNCPPCIEELPALNELKEKYKDRINFISITFDNKEKVERFLTKYKFDFAHIVGENDFTKSLGFVGYPKTFLLNKNKVIQSITGSLPPIENEEAYKVQMKWMEDELEKLF